MKTCWPRDIYVQLLCAGIEPYSMITIKKYVGVYQSMHGLNITLKSAAATPKADLSALGMASTHFVK